MLEKMYEFKSWLENSEKSNATIEKYMRDVELFLKFSGKEVEKETVRKFKEMLKEKYALSSVNSMISSVNTYLEFIGREECKVKTLKMQKKIFIEEDKNLTKADYKNLLDIAQKNGNRRLYLLLQTICSTGIRISELEYITVESLKNGYAEIELKGKSRVVLIPKQLSEKLLQYSKSKNILTGCVFVTKNGKPLDRSNVWHQMKKLCVGANVSEKKVFPHNLGHLFARTYYSSEKDIVRLADILGHSNINTTRIYTADSREICCEQIEKLGLL